MIPHSDVALAEYIIDSSGIVDILLEGRNRTNRGRKTNPRPYRLFFIGGLLNAMTRGNFVIDDVHRTLTERVDVNDQFRLGVRRRTTDSSGVTITSIMKVSELYEVTKTITATLSYGESTDVPDEEKQRRHDVIRDACDSLMDVFALDYGPTAMAIDATGLWAWHKGKYDRNPKRPDDNRPGTEAVAA